MTPKVSNIQTYVRWNWDVMKNLAIFLQRNKIECNVNNLAENVDVLSFFVDIWKWGSERQITGLHI